MKKIFLLGAFIVFSSLLINLSAQSKGNEPRSTKKIKKWYKHKDWLNGLKLTPHESVNINEFTLQYHLNKAYWDKAFAFLKEHDLKTLAKGRYQIDGDNVYAMVTEDPSKDFDKTTWESHRKYIDIQSVITGEEKIGVYPVTKATITKEYDTTKDLANYSADGKLYSATPGTFFIFFPSDAHRPNITPGGNLVVKKIVIKVRAAQSSKW
jgi:YhcH/YjgK/YiaL family protein